LDARLYVFAGAEHATINCFFFKLCDWKRTWSHLALPVLDVFFQRILKNSKFRLYESVGIFNIIYKSWIFSKIMKYNFAPLDL